MGGSKRANVYSKLLECGVVICYKERAQANSIGQMKVLGDVTGKDVIIIDDMVDTAGTLCKAADLMISNGANSVRAYCTHAILSGSAYEKIDQSIQILQFKHVQALAEWNEEHPDWPENPELKIQKEKLSCVYGPQDKKKKKKFNKQIRLLFLRRQRIYTNT